MEEGSYLGTFAMGTLFGACLFHYQIGNTEILCNISYTVRYLGPKQSAYNALLHSMASTKNIVDQRCILSSYLTD